MRNAALTIFALAAVVPVIGGTTAPAESAVDPAPERPKQTWETVISADSFASYSALESEWNYLYPWGSDHNGSARMYGSPTDHNHVSLSEGVLTLKATRIDWDEGNSSEPPYLPIRYHSGTIHAKEHVVVDDTYPEWELEGEFQAPSDRGTWPAFWITGVDSWPPESDILEYKGDARNWFNTYDGEWESAIVDVVSPGSWHTYRAHLTKANDSDVTIDYYLDGEHVGQHTGSNFVGKPMSIIVNLQMEGSSGEPGPTTDTLYHARNVEVSRNRAS